MMRNLFWVWTQPYQSPLTAVNKTSSWLTSPSNMKEYYALYHLICVFWLPSVIILISYASLSIWLQRSARGGTAKTDPRDRSNSCYSNVTTLYACTETQYQKRPLPVITVNPCDEEMGTVVHAVPVNHADTTVVSTAKHRARARSSAIRVTCLLVGAYIVCWLPYSMLLIWEFVSPTTYERYEYMSYWLNGLIVLNSVINPFLYGTFGSIHKFARNA